MDRFLKYARTLPHLKPWQVAGRVVARAQRTLGRIRLPHPPPDLRSAWSPQLTIGGHDPWNDAEQIQSGTFCFLNRNELLGRPVDWTAAHLPLLWRFNLHYFHYLHLLSPNEQAALCREWIAANPAGEGVGWHPYPTSLRIVNWCRAGFKEQDLLNSLYRQAAFLMRTLETYVYGNHLLENARALVLAGRFFEGQGEADRWLERGLALYRRETPEQILPDGGHFERSPMYHALMLEGYLDVLNVLPADHPDREWLTETVQRMGDALVTLVHPDGEVALFNDSTHEIAPKPETLVAYLQRLTGYTPEPRAALPETGYFTHRDADLFLIIDGGPVGPRHLMAHAHADVFSYELSVGGQPFIVDSGVYEYPEGPMRQYVRGTAAHNTVSIDGLDQVEVWGSFRVARRAAPHDVRFEPQPGGAQFEGRFGGFASRLGGRVTHHRRIAVDAAQRRVEVHDAIEGTGTHRAESYVHVHPAVEVEARNGQLVLWQGAGTCRIEVPDGIAWRQEEGWYCPRFGVRERNPVIVLTAEGTLPLSLSYVITY